MVSRKSDRKGCCCGSASRKNSTRLKKHIASPHSDPRPHQNDQEPWPADEENNMTRIVCGLTLVLCGLSQVPVFAQSPVAQGSRIRVTTPDGTRQRVTGNVLTMDETTMTIIDHDGQHVTIPRERITRLDV